MFKIRYGSDFWFVLTKGESLKSRMGSWVKKRFAFFNRSYTFLLRFSFGESCKFRYGPEQDTSTGVEVLLESGDAILFDGQKYFHEVLEIGKRGETAPSFFDQELVNKLTGATG